MREHHGYPAGVPCWVDIEPSDLESAGRFYSSLFGWELEDRTPPGSPNRYLVGRLRGGDVAGLGSLTGDAPAASASKWNTYVAVENAETVAARVTAAGGKLLSGPHDIPGVARVAVCTDPEGTAFRLWEANGRVGAHLVNEFGTWNMSELSTRDLEGARSFYGAVFGWEASTIDFGWEGGTADSGQESAMMLRLPGYGDFLEATSNPGIRDRHAQEGVPAGFSDCVGWMSAIGTDAPATQAPSWSITFAVADTDAIADRATQLGGQIVMPPFDAGPDVRLAILSDPEGAVFTVNRYAPSAA